MNPLVQAWQGALAAQQQAVFGYQLLGPRLASEDQGRALSAQAAHEQRRDSIAAAMQSEQVTPVSARADYPSLYPVADARQALALAARLEDQCAVAWRVLYLASAVDAATAGVGFAHAPQRREEAQAGLIEAAVAATQWRRIAGTVPASRAFPGI